MKINIEPNLQTSKNIFFADENQSNDIKIKRLEVPIYQREYDWEEDEIERLLSDLDNYVDDIDKQDSNESYFTGAVILEKNEYPNNKFEVVDGQQRLTTFFLLNFLHYLVIYYRYTNTSLVGLKGRALHRRQQKLEQSLIIIGQRLSYGDFDNTVFEEGNEDEIQDRISGSYLTDKMQLKFCIKDETNNDLLKSTVSNSEIFKSNNKLNLNAPNDNRYGENLIIIFTYLLNKNIDEADNNDKLLELIQSQIENYIEYAGVALIVSENKDDSFKLFEVLNDTARKLTVLDLLKNFFVKHLKNNFSNDQWMKLKENESNIKRVNLINDLIKSEGYTKTSREYSYLSNQIKDRVKFYREENISDYFERLFNLSHNLKSITEKDFYKKELNINSLRWNLAAIHKLKFHWGRQVMISIFHLSYIIKKEKVIDSNIWNDVDHDNIEKYDKFEALYLITSDLLIKIGLVSKVNNLSAKHLPDTAKKILKKYNDLLNKNKFSTNEIDEFISDVKNISQEYFNNQKKSFETNIKSLRYTNNSHKGTMKFLLYILYNKGENAHYNVNNMSLEHIEPISGTGEGYFNDDERESYINSLGNIVLIGQSKNSKFSNSKVNDKIELSTKKEFKNDALITHNIFSSLNKEISNDPKSYSEDNFEKLTDYDRIYDEYNAPTKSFFDNRMSFYSNELIDMIFENKKFLITGLSY